MQATVDIVVRAAPGLERPSGAREDGVRWVTEGPAEVVVETPDAPNDAGGVDPGVARVVVGPPIDGVAASVPDLAVSPAEFRADPGGTARRAWAARLALRPLPGDPPERWLEAVRVHLEVDLAAFVDRRDVLVAGDEALPADAFRALASAARDHLFAWPTREAVEDRAGWPLAGAAAAVGLGARAEHGTLVVAVRDPSEGWGERIAGPLRAVAAAAAWRACADALSALRAERDESERLLRALASIASHDLGNTLFAARLAARTLARQAGSSVATESLERSLGTSIGQLRRVVEAWRAVLDGMNVVPGTTDLEAVYGRVLTEVKRLYPARTIEGAPPDARVAIATVTAERLFTALLTNAAVHGEEGDPVRVTGGRADRSAWVVVRNRGTLPFDDFDRIEPFEHRRGAGLGFDLWYVRRLAEAAGGSLTVAVEGDDVVATLRVPLAP